MNNPEGIKALVAELRAESTELIRIAARTITGRAMVLDSAAAAKLGRRLAACADELESLTAVAGDAEVVAWRGLNELGEVVTDWIDGLKPEKLYDGDGKEASYASVQLAYSGPTRQAVEGMVLRELPGVIREMREWLMHAEREDGTQSLANADVAVRDWERRLGTALMSDAGIIAAAAPQSGKGE